MDEGMLMYAMTTFLNLIASEPDISVFLWWLIVLNGKLSKGLKVAQGVYQTPF
jgi:hypothetical protein